VDGICPFYPGILAALREIGVFPRKTETNRPGRANFMKKFPGAAGIARPGPDLQDLEREDADSIMLRYSRERL
jgi:hypothetical protein